ncbi:innate immunity activator protein-like [Coregonus clupeaformis]|uniref:innate immunity activator protein-like n=1 Tax=Coregonus clupeaformis TaxID=59861 RepID=UPI001BE0AD13|nr:innate immunity activator protein-like [Coregonus clupeaformis]
MPRLRIGATFKLDHSLIYQDGEDSELHSLETDLALQLQIVEAARRLSVEEHLSKPQKKSRLQQCNREERKVKDLQEAVFQHRIRNDCSSPPTNKKNNNTAKHNLCMSDDSSLSDAVALDDDSLSSSSSVDPLIQSSLGSLSSAQSQSLGSSCSVEQTQTQSQSLGSSCSVEQTQTQGSRMGSSCSVEQTQTQGSSLGSSCSVEQTQTQGSRMGSSCSVEFPERSPIQNSPWRESNLDQPYLKPNTPLSVCSSRPSTPVGTPVFPADSRVLPSHFPSIKNMALRHGQTNSSSAPSTPELHVRRQYSQSFRLPRSQSLMTWVRDVGEPGCHADGQSSWFGLHSMPTSGCTSPALRTAALNTLSPPTPAPLAAVPVQL